jgi:hypothetical protein
LTGTGPERAYVADWTIAVNDPWFCAAHLGLQTKPLPALPGSGAASYQCYHHLTFGRGFAPRQISREGTCANPPRPRRFGVDTGCRKRHTTLRQTTGEQCLTSQCPTRAAHFVVQRLRVSSGEKMLLQTSAAQEIPTGGELSELSW